MSNFYKMDPAAWDFGTADLSLEEEAAYLRIVNAIHKHDGPVPNNDRVVAGLFRTSTRKARTLVDALVAAKKITIEDGHIWNDRARSDLVQRGFVTISRSEAGAKGGRTRAINAAKALENKEPPQANASSRIEENREEKKEREPNGSPKKSDSALIREALTEVIGPEVAEAFIAHRLKLKKPMTPRAASMIADKLRRASDPKACADLSILKGWQDVFPENPQLAQRKPAAAGSDWWGSRDL